MVNFRNTLYNELEGMKSDGLYKNERLITTSQSAHVGVSSGAEVLNLCANNYLYYSQTSEFSLQPV